ncbi:HEPACAM family member 2-like isoform X1 [Heterodontus francisci]|uniref:HEPACAM family member 2-like isoform X1 n=1 Tax=Heterodontus francisci TaxID=7792 RepID=UPI00355BCEE6
MVYHFTLTTVLLLLRLWLIDAEAGTKEVFGVVGSSVLLDPEYGADLSNSDVIWMFTGSSGKPVTILDYVPNHPKAEPSEQFKSRLYFNVSSGSLMLNSLKASDQGVYTITVHGQQTRNRDLKLIEPLSEPLINVAYVDTTIELTCRVSAGKVNSILWRKGDEVITNGQHCQLVQKSNKLIISKANKSDCGIYTCTVENPVSKKNNSYSLSIYGLPYLHRYTMGLSIAALILAAAALICRIISFLPEAKTSCHSLENLLQVLQFAPMLSLILLIAAFVFWIQVEGAAGITVFMLVFLCALLILSILSTLCMMACVRKRLNKILKSKFCPLLLGAVITSGVITVIWVSAVLIEETVKQMDKGCEPAANLQSNIIPAVVVPLVFCSLYIVYKKHKQRTTRTLSACPSVKEPDELQHTDVKGPFLDAAAPIPVTNCHRCSSTDPGDELPQMHQHRSR